MREGFEGIREARRKFPLVIYLQVPSMNYVYALISIIVVLLMVCAYIKITYPFWNLQPVYHTYSRPWRWWYPKPYVIEPNGHAKNKFYCPTYVITVSYGDMEEDHVHAWMDFMRCHAIPSDRVLWTTTKEQWHNLVTHSPCSSVVSLYHNELGTLQGCTHSVCYHMNLYGISHNIMYQDMVCIHREMSNTTKTLHALLGTHWVRQFEKHPDMLPVTMLKKEGDLRSCAGVVPLVKYKSYLFSLARLSKLRHLPENIRCVKMDPVTLDTCMLQAPFHLKVHPNMFGMIRSEEIFAYCLRQGDNVVACYFFRDIHTQYEEPSPGTTIACIGSFFNNQEDTHVGLFWDGWMHSIRAMVKDKAFCYVLVEGTSHNVGLVPVALKTLDLISEPYDAAYYMINMICPNAPLLPEQCLMF